MVRSGDGTGEGVAGTELSLFGDSGAPDGEGDDLFDGVASFSAMVFAIGERVVFRRHAVGEFEGAADLRNEDLPTKTDRCNGPAFYLIASVGNARTCWR